MNKSIAAVAVAMALMGSVHAGGFNLPGSGDNNNDNRNTNLNSNSANALGVGVGVGISNSTASVGVRNSMSNRVSNHNNVSNRVSNDQGQLQGQVQGQDNDQNMTYNETDSMRYSGKYRVATNPSMGLGGSNPTVPCAIPVEGTYSGVGIGVGIGTAYVEEGCVLDRLIKSGLTSGNPEAVAKAATILNHQLDEALEAYEVKHAEAAADAYVPTADQANVWSFQQL